MMSKSYRRAEKLLYMFPVNFMRLYQAIEELRRLRRETDCHAQNYEQSHGSAGTHSDPVANYAARINSLEAQIRDLQEHTRPVYAVRMRLKNSADDRYREMFYVMELYYFEHMKLVDVAIHLQKSVRTLSRRRQELAELVAREL